MISLEKNFLVHLQLLVSVLEATFLIPLNLQDETNNLFSYGFIFSNFVHNKNCGWPLIIYIKSLLNFKNMEVGKSRSSRSSDSDSDQKMEIPNETNSPQLELQLLDNLSGQTKKFTISDWDSFIQSAFASDFTLGTSQEINSDGDFIPRFQIAVNFDARKCKLLVQDERLKYIKETITRKNLDDFKIEIQRKITDLVNSKQDEKNPYVYEKGEWYKGLIVDSDEFWVPCELFLITDRVTPLCCAFRSLDLSFIFGKNISNQELFAIRNRRLWFEKGWSYHLDQQQIQFNIREGS